MYRMTSGVSSILKLGGQGGGRQKSRGVTGQKYSCLPMAIYRENLNVEREFNQISVRYNNLVHTANYSHIVTKLCLPNKVIIYRILI